MPSLVTLANMRDITRLYADERPGGTDTFLSNDEIDVLLNRNLRFFYDKLVAARGHDYYEASDQSQTTAGISDYALPDDYYETRMVFLAWSGPPPADLELLNPFERLEEPALINLKTWGRGTTKGYRIIADRLVIQPTPQSEVLFGHFYIPAFVDLDDDADTFDGINGWEKAPCLQTAIEILGLQGKDTSVQEGWLQREIDRIDVLAADRSSTGAKQVRDVSPEFTMQRRWPERLPPA